MTMTHDSATSEHDALTRPRRQLVSTLSGLGAKYGLIGLLVALVVFFSVLPSTGETFRSLGNAQAVMGNVSVVGIVAIAAVIPLIAGNIDFTVGATSGLCAAVVATFMSQHDWPMATAIAAAMTVALIVAIANATVVAVLHVNPFIVTLGASIFLSGLTQWYTGGRDLVGGISPVMTDFGSSTLWVIPAPFILLVAVVVAAWFVTTSTPAGRRLRAIGSNPDAAALVGVRVDRLVFLSLVASSLLAGVAGVLLVARNGGVPVGAGQDLLFPALAAAFLGATVLDPGRYNVLGTLIGVIFVAAAVSGLTLAGAAAWVPSFFNGAALVLAVLWSTLLARRRQT
ncbi:branched-chain amino acid ABC transporter, permease protein [Aeromicrobium marinum DSM 15272]|uniref:Branched-chain amino acid ABC transporter, permease protein n=1 Tax=Aeromicrobium marinum DSM 15272 TaxID=585531 RepID=E2S888_9ACTN|nr:ABC transporter permease [Aeromicrobium marinum]EFQ84393.1 branched-chain amino acid ABC transporter, permease protein [Aeromicrobium marinum DSM 15272]